MERVYTNVRGCKMYKVKLADNKIQCKSAENDPEPDGMIHIEKLQRSE